MGVFQFDVVQMKKTIAEAFPEADKHWLEQASITECVEALVLHAKNLQAKYDHATQTLMNIEYDVQTVKAAKALIDAHRAFEGIYRKRMAEAHR